MQPGLLCGKVRFPTMLIFLAVVATANLRIGPAQAEVLSPVEVLAQEKGLKRTGQFWLCPTELRLRRRLELLPEWQMRIEARRRDLEVAIERNLIAWNQYQTVLAGVERLSRTLRQLGPAARKPVMEEIARDRERLPALKLQASEPALLGETPEVQALLIELTSDLQATLLTVYWIRENWPTLAEKYEQLAADPQVTAALSELSVTSRLGPARDYEAEIQKLGRFEELVYSLPIPMYRESGRLRLGALINDKTPVTFSWRTTSGPITLTANMIEAAELTVPADAPREQLRVDSQRELTVRRFTVPYLRLGKYLLQEVEAYALPPQGEDLGAQIGPSVLADYKVTLQPERLRMLIEPKE